MNIASILASCVVEVFIGLTREASGYFSEKITNETDLYLHLLEQKSKLGIYEPIVLRDKSGGYMPVFTGARCLRLQGVTYIDYDRDDVCLTTLRHELYHIYRKDHDNLERIDNFRESKCDIYAMTGLRL